MKDYVGINQKILDRWYEEMEKNGDNNFASDGIMFRGKIIFTERGSSIREQDSKAENKLWNNAPLRILFLTKDQNTGGDDAWDVRGERFFSKNCILKDGSRNFQYSLVYQSYGFINTDGVKIIQVNNVKRPDAIHVFDTCALARINVKKQGGGSRISYNKLKTYIDKYQDFIKKQIENLDADILVCCGHSDKIEKTGNMILNFLNEHLYSFERINDWIYYDTKKNKIAVDTYHLSASGYKGVCDEIMKAYHKFLVKHPDFLEKIRSSR